MIITINSLLQVLIIFQGVLLALFLFFQKKGKRISHRLLGAILLLLAWQMLGIFMSSLDTGRRFFESINCLYGFLYGPLFFLYTQSVTKKNFSLKKTEGLHFMPFLLAVIGVLATNGTFCRPIVYIAYVTSILIYILLSFLRIRRYQRVVKNNYSRAEMMRLDWLLWAFILFCFVVGADMFSFAFFMLGIPDNFLDMLVFILILAFINTLYFKGLQQAVIFTGFSEEDAHLSDELSRTGPKVKIDTESKAILEQLEQFMQTHHPYRDPNLNIAQLANQMELPKRKLSELINVHYGQNFVDFINTYRIEEAKTRFLNPLDEKETILEVMYAVGFNSKSSFNTIFKKKTGMTPSQFKARRTNPDQ